MRRRRSRGRAISIARSTRARTAEAAMLRRTMSDSSSPTRRRSACAAAARAGVPSFVVSNFTWDWIYAEYREDLASAPGLIPTIQAAYRPRGRRVAPADARRVRNVPIRLADIPFVARPRRRTIARNARAARSAARSPPGAAVLRRLRSAEDSTSTRSIARDRGGRPRSTTAPSTTPASATKIWWAPSTSCSPSPATGFISECIANDTALVYTSRGRFAEYPVLVREMPRYLRCADIDNDALLAGRWHAALEAAVGAPPPPERPRTDGAAIDCGYDCGACAFGLKAEGDPDVHSPQLSLVDRRPADRSSRAAPVRAQAPAPPVPPSLAALTSMRDQARRSRARSATRASRRRAA